MAKSFNKGYNREDILGLRYGVRGSMMGFVVSGVKNLAKMHCLTKGEEEVGNSRRDDSLGDYRAGEGGGAFTRCLFARWFRVLFVGGQANAKLAIALPRRVLSRPS
ncbi:hypothetical protein PQX77_018846 [Marasmius sp. AFHP31]|nr:hypothetical protein PQX77_018846 [Marasmius sp. AFHP31]